MKIKGKGLVASEVCWDLRVTHPKGLFYSFPEFGTAGKPTTWDHKEK